MKLLLATALALAGLTVAAPANAGPPAPTQVRTTLQLQKDGTHRAVATGRAPAGVRLLLQNRLDKRQRYATVKSGRAAGNGTFRIDVDLNGNVFGKYRVCTINASGKTCTGGFKPTVLLRKGTIDDVTFPDQIVEGEYGQISAHLSRWLQGAVWKLQYRDNAGTWTTVFWSWQIMGGSTAEVFVPLFGPLPGMPGGLAVAFRIVTEGSHYVARAVSETFSRPVYRAFKLSTLTPVSGALTVRDDGYTVTPAGTSPTQSATLALPQNCGRLVFSFLEDTSDWQPDDLFTGAVSVNGTTVYDHPASSTQDYDRKITLPPHPTQLTLSASYDALEPTHRPWFAPSNAPFFAPRGPYVLCAS